jgi:octopine/nopaline transport system permease protein/arginine/ornithine transport system permease protein
MIAVITDNLGRFAWGTVLTLQLTAVSCLIGFLLSIPMAVGRLSKNPFIRWPIFAYMFVFRGSPLLVQLFLIYYGSGQFVPQLKALGLWDGFFREAYFCALLTLVLNTAAYTAEILRGAILGVPNGEIEAAKAFGMSRLLQLRRVVFPRAFRIGLPAYTNEIVFLFQATSLVSVITLVDLTGAARDIISDTLRPYPVWIFTGAVYCAISYTLFWFLGRVEWHWSGHLRARPGTEGKADATQRGAAAGATVLVR